MENWKIIEDFPKYSVSNKGNVKINKSNHILKPCNTSGYSGVVLCNKGVKKFHYVHRLVADAFCDNPNNYPCVNHIDENKSNNNACNLEWCTYEYNINYGTRTMRAKQTKRNNYHVSGRIIIVDNHEFDSISNAATYIGVPRSTLNNYTRKFRKFNYKGFSIELP